MSNEANTLIVRRYLELYNTGEVSIADEVLSPDFVDHSHSELKPGPEDVKYEVAAFRAAFPDAQAFIEQIVSEDDIVAFRFMLHGTHSGTFAGIPATGKQATLTGMDFMRIDRGKIVELWSSQDTLPFLQQLGVKFG